MFKKIANHVATLGPVGFLPFAGLVSTVLALPIIFMVNAIVWAMPIVYPLIYILLFGGCTILLIAALDHAHTVHQPRSTMVINHILGLLFVFSGIALNIKILATGCVAFLLLRHFLPRVMLRYAGINCTAWPAVIHLLFVDVVAGLLANFVFRFIFWLVTISS